MFLKIQSLEKQLTEEQEKTVEIKSSDNHSIVEEISTLNAAIVSLREREALLCSNIEGLEKQLVEEKDVTEKLDAEVGFNAPSMRPREYRRFRSVSYAHNCQALSSSLKTRNQQLKKPARFWSNSEPLNKPILRLKVRKHNCGGFQPMIFREVEDFLKCKYSGHSSSISNSTTPSCLCCQRA